MEAVRDWVECINGHWIAMIAAGMYTHIRQICIIGFCFEDGPIVHPSYPSLLFTFSILSVFAEHKPWPRSLKAPPAYLLYIYEMLVAALVANLSTRVIWTPLVHVIWALTQESSKWLMWINSTMGLNSYSVVAGLANFMATDEAANYMTSCLSILSFVWMMDATESLDALLDYLSSSQEDDYDDWGTQVKLFFFAAGVYVIIARVTLFPSSFRQPVAPFLCLYELLATMFIIEFSLACVWSPIDALLLHVFPKRICHMLKESQQTEVADVIIKYELPMALTYLVSFGFFLMTLHITEAVDFSIYNIFGLKICLEVALYKLYQRISSEFPSMNQFVRFVDEPYNASQRRKYSRCQYNSCCRSCR